MPVEITTISLISQDMLVNLSTTDLYIFSVFQPYRYMFWAPVNYDQTLNQTPGFGMDAKPYFEFLLEFIASFT
jgi:hypothetical protein